MPKISLFTKYTSLTIIAILAIAFFSYNLPAKYQLANLLGGHNPIVSGETIVEEDTPATTLTTLPSEQMQNLKEETVTLYELLQPKKNHPTPLQLGHLILTKEDDFFLTPDSITSNSIKWHTIKTEDLETNSITSRTIEDKTIQKEDLSPSLKDQIYATDSEAVAETDPIFTAWNKSTGISITESQITDLKTYLTANQTITLSGDISGTGTTSIATTLPTINSSIGTFNNLTINAKGQVTAGSNISYLTSYTETDATFSTWLNAGSPSLNTLTLTQITGTAPMQITSTTKVANLNADLLDGFDSSAFGDATAANQTEILTRIGTNADVASMSSTLFAGQQYIADGVDALQSRKVMMKSQEFTSSGTWTRPAGVTVVNLVLVGGGANGVNGDPGVNTNIGGAGGGAGQVNFLNGISVSGNLAVVVGGPGGNTTVGGYVAVGNTTSSAKVGIGYPGSAGGAVGVAGTNGACSGGAAGAGASGGGGGAGGYNAAGANGANGASPGYYQGGFGGAGGGAGGVGSAAGGGCSGGAGGSGGAGYGAGGGGGGGGCASGGGAGGAGAPGYALITWMEEE